MIKLMIVILAVNLGLFSCVSAPEQDKSSANDNKSSTSSPKAQTNSKETDNQEPSIKQIEESVPPDLLKKSDCSIEEDVTLTPESGGQAPLMVTFDARASKAPCGKIIKSVWDFGDGTKAKGLKVKHTYSAPGKYIATLTMTDNKGNTNLINLEHVVLITEALSSPAKGKSP
ncbi:MAG: PKD domain-containing protein [Acidobacteriota bacterium]